MTNKKREPFVKDVEKIFLDMFGEWGVSDGLECPISGIYDDQQEEFFFRLNAAHEARVKEAVEEFRDRVANHIRSECIACQGAGQTKRGIDQRNKNVSLSRSPGASQKRGKNEKQKRAGNKR